ASGLLVSGTSMATVIGLAVARQKVLGQSVRSQGNGAHGLVAYTSAEAHSAIAKAFELLGLGSECLRRIASMDDFTLDVGALEAAIRADRAAGFRPFAVIATVGTVNTGASDDIVAIADIAAREKLWLHVDGAFGALAILSSRHKERVEGVERADSLAFDFHKWLHVPYDAGCILVRDGAAHLAAFSSRPDYLSGAARGLAAGEPWLCEYGPDLSRGFRALKVWMTLKTYGTDALGAAIAANCDLAQYLGQCVERDEALQLMAPVALNIVCFRVCPEGMDERQRDGLNGEIVMQLHERGIAAPSLTRVRGRAAIRVNITNHRTTAADLDALLAGVRMIADKLSVTS
ncbi:MAG: pyridoxal-dependent decarboxylase, partial [Hyphomicrobiaceae bacterium]